MKQKYLDIRSNLLNGDVPISFLAEWCALEKRDFNILMYILNEANKAGRLIWCLNKLVVYLDNKFVITKVFRTEDNIIIKIY